MTKNKLYQPYESTTLDTPLLHMVLKPLLPAIRPVLEGVFRFRWMLSRPLEVRVFPKFIPAFYFSSLTVGDLLMTLPLIIFLFAGYNQAFVVPSVEDSGVIASYAIYWTFLTANKANSLLSFLFGIPFERMLPHHYMASFVAVVLGVFHTYVAFAYGDAGGDGDGESASASGSEFSSGSGSVSDSDSGDRYLMETRRLSGDDSEYALNAANPNFVKFLMDGENNITGTLLFTCLALLLLTSFFRIFRKYFFNVWLVTHITLAIGVIVFCVMHEVISILFIALWWGIDLAARYVVMAGCRYPQKALIRKISPDICEVSFEKPPGFSYNPGQFVQIAVRQLSALEFHPISISSAPHEDIVTLHIRGLGDWSKKLVKLAEEGRQEVNILLEGPYGSLSVDLDDFSRYRHVLLVCGGIGVTHCMSVGKALQYQAKIEGRKLASVRLIWAVRDLDMVRDMPPLEDSMVKKTRRTQESGKTRISKEVYCSRSQPDSEDPLPGDVKLLARRPALDTIFSEMKQEAIDCGDFNIAVFGCGPSHLMDSLRENCRQHSQSIAGCGGVYFDLHMEHFEF